MLNVAQGVILKQNALSGDYCLYLKNYYQSKHLFADEDYRSYATVNLNSQLVQGHMYRLVFHLNQSPSNNHFSSASIGVMLSQNHP
jgi:hypothetical protein